MNKKLTFLLFSLFGIGILNAQNPAFADISELAGVNHGGGSIGIAFGDFNNDDLDDIYVSCRDDKNRLYKNLGDGIFQDVAEFARLDHSGNSRTAVWGDINNDGYLDLYLGNFNEADKLFLNNGDETFTDISTQAGINSPAKAFSVNMCDVDQDGLIDIYVANFATENILYQNNGDTTFTDITTSAGVSDQLNSMGAIFFDYDNDRDPDLYLTHDGQANILYQNDGTGHFTDVSAAAGVNFQGNGMGVDFADVNNDGFLDMYITNLFENVLFINNQNGTFTNIAGIVGVDDYGMAWGCNFLDYNNDAHPDIYVSNDSYFSPYPNVLYKNEGSNVFSRVEEGNPVSSMQGGYGSACADINGDGSVDLMIANAAANDHNQMFLNQLDAGNWITFKLTGTLSNRSAIGARIELIDENGIYQMDEVAAGTGYASQNSMVQHFGLDDADTVTSLAVIWPSGQVQYFQNVEAGCHYALTEGEELIPCLSAVSPNELSHTSGYPLIFPNPSSDFFNIKLSDVWSGSTVSIYNSEGVMVYHDLIPSDVTEFIWTATSKWGDKCNPGIYLLLIQGRDVSKTIKLFYKP